MPRWQNRLENLFSKHFYVVTSANYVLLCLCVGERDCLWTWDLMNIKTFNLETVLENILIIFKLI